MENSFEINMGLLSFHAAKDAALVVNARQLRFDNLMKLYFSIFDGVDDEALNCLPIFIKNDLKRNSLQLPSHRF